ncbi:hypothetical protein ROHU_011962 [Labeo rohita]|uniref:Uncharacterized protein n=1 Tax=Labeo rohita TaxID=84645 RepID=A0A498LNX4_LABRO|nr:hypothetical protein ROHU_011962 [Labeo rohita]
MLQQQKTKPAAGSKVVSEDSLTGVGSGADSGVDSEFSPTGTGSGVDSEDSWTGVDSKAGHARRTAKRLKAKMAFLITTDTMKLGSSVATCDPTRVGSFGTTGLKTTGVGSSRTTGPPEST